MNLFIDSRLHFYTFLRHVVNLGKTHYHTAGSVCQAASDDRSVCAGDDCRKGPACASASCGDDLRVHRPQCIRHSVSSFLWPFASVSAAAPISILWHYISHDNQLLNAWETSLCSGKRPRGWPMISPSASSIFREAAGHQMPYSFWRDMTV